MMTDSFFFDSYALYEILVGSENYTKYANCEIKTTKLNIFEVYYNLLRKEKHNEANEFISLYIQFAIDFDENVIKDAAKLKLSYKKQDLSMADCIGYIIAKKLSIKFLTGDKEFQNMENVEFVK